MSEFSRVPTYRERLLEFAANQTIQFPVVGDFIAFIDIAGTFQMSLDEGPVSDIRAGITFKMPPGETFKTVRFTETAGATGNIRFVVARGEVLDARASISGNVSVQNAASPNDSLQVDLLSTDPGIVVLKELLDQTNNAMRAPLRDLTNATFVNITNNTSDAYTDIITAAANTGGILIHRASIGGAISSEIRLRIGTDHLIGQGTSTSARFYGDYQVIENVILKSGVALQYASVSDNFVLQVAYELL